MTSSAWNTFPTEMKLAVVEALDVEDIKAFSQVDQQTYQLCVPSTFKVSMIVCLYWDFFSMWPLSRM